MDSSTRRHVIRVNSLEDALLELRLHEERTNARFVCTKKPKDFGHASPAVLLSKPHRVLWGRTTTGNRLSDSDLTFDGTPYVSVASSIFTCHHGPNLKKAANEKLKKGSSSVADHSYIRKKQMIQTRKKFGCPATVILREILKFPNYKIDEDTPFARRLASQRLHNDLGSPGDDNLADFRYEHYIEIDLPSNVEHQFHKLDKGLTELAMLTLYEFFQFKYVYDHDSILVPMNATFLTLRKCANATLMHIIEIGGDVHCATTQQCCEVCCRRGHSDSQRIVCETCERIVVREGRWNYISVKLMRAIGRCYGGRSTHCGRAVGFLLSVACDRLIGSFPMLAMSAGNWFLRRHLLNRINNISADHTSRHPS